MSRLSLASIVLLAASALTTSALYSEAAALLGSGRSATSASVDRLLLAVGVGIWAATWLVSRRNGPRRWRFPVAVVALGMVVGVIASALGGVELVVALAVCATGGVIARDLDRDEGDQDGTRDSSCLVGARECVRDCGTGEPNDHPNDQGAGHAVPCLFHAMTLLVPGSAQRISIEVDAESSSALMLVEWSRGDPLARSRGAPP